MHLQTPNAGTSVVKLTIPLSTFLELSVPLGGITTKKYFHPIPLSNIEVKQGRKVETGSSSRTP
jgi:hypothetical protein